MTNEERITSNKPVVAETTPVAETTATEETATTGTTANTTLPTNAEREKMISDMYDAKLAADKASLASEYQQNMAEAQYNKAKLATDYQSQKNTLSATNEQNRRNANMSATASGLNTGTQEQANVARSNQYSDDYTSLAKQEAEANTEADRNMNKLTTDYNQSVDEAKSSSDYNKAQAMLDEYNEQYNRQLTQAASLATYGDFSGYAVLYGQAIADNMKEVWSLQNPLLAYNLGYITADKYFGMTGSMPR